MTGGHCPGRLDLYRQGELGKVVKTAHLLISERRSVGAPAPNSDGLMRHFGLDAGGSEDSAPEAAKRLGMQFPISGPR